MFADLSNPYCNTDLKLYASLLLCFESTPSQDFDGCFDYWLLNEHFDLEQYNVNNSTWLGVKGINTSLNEIVISIFCITESPDNCLQSSYIETNIFNFIILNGNGIIENIYKVSWLTWYFSVCNNCSKDATCEEGMCVCKQGYRGDGIICNSDGKLLLE